MMKIVILVLFLVMMLMGIALLRALKAIAQEESDFAAAMIPTFSIAQSAKCNLAMKIEQTKNHRFDAVTPYDEQLEKGIDSLNAYKLTNNISISNQYEEGQHG